MPGKRTGVATRPHKKSTAATAQRRTAASKSRPGRRPLTSSEERGRVLTVKLGRALCPKLMKILWKRTTLSERVQYMIDKELANPVPDFEKIAELQKVAQTNMDLSSALREVADRFGHPRESVQDVRFREASRQPLFFRDDGQVSAWDQEGPVDDGSGDSDPTNGQAH